MSEHVFEPAVGQSVGATVNISTSTSSAQGTLLAQFRHIRVHNASSAVAYLRWGTADQTAVTTDMSMPAGGVEVFDKKGATKLAAILASGTGTLNITHGEGP